MDWPDPKPAGTALAQMARLTGDRKRDLDPADCRAGDPVAEPVRMGPPLLKPFKEVLPMEETENNLAFGESLPSGIRMHVE